MHPTHFNNHANKLYHKCVSVELCFQLTPTKISNTQPWGWKDEKMEHLMSFFHSLEVTLMESRPNCIQPSKVGRMDYQYSAFERELKVRGWG